MLAAGGALIWFAAVVPLQEWRQSALNSRERALEGFQQLQDRIAALKAERAILSESGELGVLWRASQTGEATALVQSHLSQLATGSGVSLRSISPTRARDMTLAQASAFRLEMEAPLDKVASFLRDVENNEPALLVEKASLRRSNRPNSEQAQPLVFVQLEVLAPAQIDQEVEP